jgi:hypothetical protein
MRLLRNCVAVVFFAVVSVYARAVDATSPFEINCNETCEYGIHAYTCTFVGQNASGYFCEAFPPYGSARGYMQGVCGELGFGHEPLWFTMDTCWENSINGPDGSFYCSWDDYNCI